MFSYRHSFHAGNHADVLKHLVQMLLLEKLKLKSKPFVYIDTHSGAGVYDLNSEQARKNREFETGVGLLDKITPQHPAIAAYCALIAEYSAMQRYPGSPEIARRLVREQDKLILMEWHSQEIGNLRHNMAKSQASVHHRDGFEGLVAISPPNPARGMVLMDPPYELADEYEQVAQSITQASKRWATGIYAIWYPLLSARAGSKPAKCQSMLQQLAQLPVKNVLDVKLWVDDVEEDTGMYGSGLVIINAPWQLDSDLEEALPELCRLLADRPQAGFSVQWLKQED